MDKYTPEQISDIKERVDKAIVFLKGLDLELQAQVSVANTGNDVFGVKVTPFLKDLKYLNEPTIESEPVQKVTDVEATPTVSPFISQPNTDENNTDTATA